MLYLAHHIQSCSGLDLKCPPPEAEMSVEYYVNSRIHITGLRDSVSFSLLSTGMLTKEGRSTVSSIMKKLPRNVYCPYHPASTVSATEQRENKIKKYSKIKSSRIFLWIALISQPIASPTQRLTLTILQTFILVIRSHIERKIRSDNPMLKNSFFTNWDKVDIF